ncbi:MAG TPA: peptidylprolyl isomerase, partial [Candidatus Paceibacterota bacterium]
PLASKHPVFGQIVSGMDIVDKISGVPTRVDGEGSYPVEPVVIEKVEMK